MFAQFVVAVDRSLNQLGEKRREQEIPEEILFRTILAVVYINQISQRLERIE